MYIKKYWENKEQRAKQAQAHTREMEEKHKEKIAEAVKQTKIYGTTFVSLKYKLTDRGKYFIKVDKWYPSSQICHHCGKVHKEMKDLSIRTMNCFCGMVMDRDQNSAKNIRKEDLRILKNM